MKRGIAIFVVIFFVTVFEAQGQKSKLLLDNQTIEYIILKTPTRFLDSNKIEISQNLVQVNSGDSVREKILNLKYADWISYLKNTSTDWAANIWLYDINKRDGSIFRIYKDRESWVKCCKIDDIKYWEKQLKHR